MDVPLPTNSISGHLAWAKEEKERAISFWTMPVSGFVTEGYHDADAYILKWDQIIRTLEALDSAANLSRVLYGDCVELPSRDPRHLSDPAVLHSLLMQQLDSLATRLGSRRNTAGAVPLAVRASDPVVELRVYPPEERPPDDQVPEEEEGSTCSIA